MDEKNKKLNIFWFRRDLRLIDNAGLYHALKSTEPVLCLFIFDKNILDHLEKDDSRVHFIFQTISSLKLDLEKTGSSLLVKYGKAEQVWKDLLHEYNIKQVYVSDDYEPYARERDQKIQRLLDKEKIGFTLVKDHVIFDKSEIVKGDGQPYMVFTPYKNQWLKTLNPAFHLKKYHTERYFSNLYKIGHIPIPSLKDLGFNNARFEIPPRSYKSKIEKYGERRDFPSLDGTTKIGIHLRFGTISIREAAAFAWESTDKTWLNELIWRDFYAMILWHFPESATNSFRKKYDDIPWRNNEEEFKHWCEGTTGYPIVDAAMRQLNSTGWMHNRLRMIAASFLTKHLLIDWRWGEAYFAALLLDYEQSSNVGGWQWASGSGTDAAPYFRVFNPDLQTKKFDPELKFIKKWVPEFSDPFSYPHRIVDHNQARERALRVYREALNE